MGRPQSGTARLLLEPLGRHHATEMVDVLAAPELYKHIGGTPPSAAELEARYARLVAGSPDHDVEWRNWVLRCRTDAQAVGFVQATMTPAPASGRRAEVAWMVGLPWQGRGLATEAAGWLLGEVGRLGATEVVAHIAATNRASQAVARRIDLQPTGFLVEGEQEWRLTLPRRTALRR